MNEKQRAFLSALARHMELSQQLETVRAEMFARRDLLTREELDEAYDKGDLVRGDCLCVGIGVVDVVGLVRPYVCTTCFGAGSVPSRQLESAGT